MLPSSGGNDEGSAYDCRRPEEDGEDSAVGLFGRPLDVRGAPPGPRYGHTMTVLSNNERRRGRPFAVVAGGTGFDHSLCTAPRDVLVLASIYTLTCVAPDDGECDVGCSHLVWDRVADMPSPRSYHASFILEGHHGGDRDVLFVFGGYEDADDPFTSRSSASSSSSSPSSWLKAPLRFRGEYPNDMVDVSRPSDHADAMSNIAVDDELRLPARIGSSAVSLRLKSNIPAVLIVGGAKSLSTAPAPSSCSDSKRNSCLDDGDDGEEPSLILIAPRDEKRHQPREPIRLQSVSPLMMSSELEVVSGCDSGSGGGHDTVDFGACVHHCLVGLPRQRDDDDDDDDDDEASKAASPMAYDDYPASAIIVGGGVPSLSFGQSYAR